mgnify:FL=1
MQKIAHPTIYKLSRLKMVAIVGLCYFAALNNLQPNLPAVKVEFKFMNYQTGT